MAFVPEEQFRDFLIRRSQFLFELENGALQQMVGPYAKAKGEINQRLRNLIDDTSQGFTKEFRISRMRNQVAEIDALFQVAAIDASFNLEDILNELVVMDSDVYVNMLDAQFSKIGVDVSSIPHRQVDFILNNRLLGEEVQSKLFRTSEEITRKIRGELTQSIIQGEDMVRATNRLWKFAGTKIGGEMGKLIQRRSEVIARSEIQYVSNQVARASYEQNSDIIKALEHSASLDRRTCLLPETKVLTATGYKEIALIKKEDLVLTHKNNYKKVLNKWKSKRSNYLRIELSNKKILNITPDHEVKIKDWIEIGKLKIGNKLDTLYSGIKFEILAIEEINEEVDVYDIEVEDDHSFIAEGVTVHNCVQCMSLDGKIYPMQPDGTTNAPLLPVHAQGRCFVDKNTTILTNKGYKPIIEIKKEDLVLTHKNRFKKVTNIIRNKVEEVNVIEISINNFGFVLVTEEHPFYNVKKEWIEAKNLEADWRLKCYDKEFMDLRVTSIIKKTLINKKGIILYNFSVEDDESYIANGFVTHNCVYIPITRSWRQLGLKIPEGVSKAQKENFTGNPLKDKLTYNAWLKGQSGKVQKEILGKGRYKLWKDGDLKLEKMATSKKILGIKGLKAKTESLLEETIRNV